MSINIGTGLKPALDATDVIQKAAVFIVEGRRYCFYFDGWHGAGWYRCGFAYRRNFGWGGEYGWQGWSYGPAERRLWRTRGRARGRSKSKSERSGQAGTSGRHHRSPQPTGSGIERWRKNQRWRADAEECCASR